MDAGGSDEHIGTTEAGAHAFGGHDHAIEFADIARQAEGDAAGMLNLEVGEIDFGFGASDQPDGGSLRRQTDGEAFSNAATGSGDEYAFSLQVKLNRRVSQCKQSGSMPTERGALLRAGFSAALDGIHGLVGATQKCSGILAFAMFDDADGGTDRDGERATID